LPFSGAIPDRCVALLFSILVLDVCAGPPPQFILVDHVPNWLQHFMDSKLSDPSLAHEIFKYELEPKDFVSLGDGNWLTDSIVNSYLLLMISLVGRHQPHRRLFVMVSNVCDNLDAFFSKGARKPLELFSRHPKRVCGFVYLCLEQTCSLTNL